MIQASRLLIAIGVLALTTPAFAGKFFLSDYSSGAMPANELTATLDLSLSDGILTIIADNQSSFDITGFAFNGKDSFTLSPTSANITGDPSTGWAYDTGVDFDMFGTFDYALTSALIGDESLLPAGGTSTFTFLVNGTALMRDFMSGKSDAAPGSMRTKAAAIFQSDSSRSEGSEFGACLECIQKDGAQVVPLPSAAGMGLLSLGGLMLTRRRRS